MSEMRKEQFTPGPWNHDNQYGKHCIWKSDPENTTCNTSIRHIAVVFGGKTIGMANATLIATAPEMYDFVHFFETVAGQEILLAAQKSGMKKEAHEIYEEAVRLCKKARGEENE